MKRVPTQMPSAPSASAAARPRPSTMPAGRDHRHPVADRVDDLRHERERGDLAGVAAGLGALGDDDVAAGLDRGDGVADLAAHVDDEHVAAVAEVDDVTGHAETGDEHRAATVDDVVDLGRHVPGRGGEQVDAERLVGAARAPWRSRRASRSAAMVDAPMQPKPPASLTRRRRAGGTTPRPSRPASRGARPPGRRSVECACRDCYAPLDRRVKVRSKISVERSSRPASSRRTEARVHLDSLTVHPRATGAKRSASYGALRQPGRPSTSTGGPDGVASMAHAAVSPCRRRRPAHLTPPEVCRPAQRRRPARQLGRRPGR